MISFGTSSGQGVSRRRAYKSPGFPAAKLRGSSFEKRQEGATKVELPRENKSLADINAGERFAFALGQRLWSLRTLAGHLRLGVGVPGMREADQNQRRNSFLLCIL
jgi:hypothetical protein